MILRFAVVTCSFYLVITLLIQMAFFLVARWRGEALLYATRWGWILLFGLVWLLSFRLAWHFVLPHKVPGSM